MNHTELEQTTDGQQLWKTNLHDFPLADLLSAAATSVKHPSAAQSKLLGQIDYLRERLLKNCFQLAVLGQFKRGKSTLLNALLHAEVLPAGVVPVTAIPTFIQKGETPALRVSYINGQATDLPVNGLDSLRENLKAFVTEDRNPGNRLGVARVDVRIASPKLGSGLVLIDTPGVGSTLRHNTAAADGVLPECDAAMFVVSPDPPITEIEIEFLSRIRKTVAGLFIVLNKMDTLNAEDHTTVEAYLRRVLTEQAKLDLKTRIFCLSARKAIFALREGGDIRASGIVEIESYLTKFLATEKSVALNAAVAKKAAALLGEVRFEIEIILKALHLPIEELEKRTTAFDEAAKRFESERRSVGDLLAGDRLRSLQELEAETEKLRSKAWHNFEHELESALSDGNDANEARDILANKLVAFFDAALQEFAREVGERLSQKFRVHERQAEAIISDVRQTAANLLDVPLDVPSSDEMFQTRREPFWVTASSTAELNPVPPEVLDQFLPASIRKKRVRQRLLKQIERAVSRNIENLRWATLQNLEDAYRRFSAEFDESLATSIKAVYDAMKTPLKFGTDVEAIQSKIAEWETQSKQVRGIEQALRKHLA